MPGLSTTIVTQRCWKLKGSTTQSASRSAKFSHIRRTTLYLSRGFRSRAVSNPRVNLGDTITSRLLVSGVIQFFSSQTIKNSMLRLEICCPSSRDHQSSKVRISGPPNPWYRKTRLSPLIALGSSSSSNLRGHGVPLPHRDVMAAVVGFLAHLQGDRKNKEIM